MDWKEQLALLAGVEVPQPEEPSEVREPSPPAEKHPLRLSMERAGRGGKTVTLVRGFKGTEQELAALARQLKARLGLGGSAKDGEIVIQGDVRQRLLALLHEMGYRQAK